MGWLNDIMLATQKTGFPVLANRDAQVTKSADDDEFTLALKFIHQNFETEDTIGPTK